MATFLKTIAQVTRLRNRTGFTCLGQKSHFYCSSADAVLRSRVAFDLSHELIRVLELRAKYASVPMSLADACLVRLTELLSDSIIVTTDANPTFATGGGVKLEKPGNQRSDEKGLHQTYGISN